MDGIFYCRKPHRKHVTRRWGKKNPAIGREAWKTRYKNSLLDGIETGMRKNGIRDDMAKKVISDALDALDMEQHKQSLPVLSLRSYTRDIMREIHEKGTLVAVWGPSEGDGTQLLSNCMQSAKILEKHGLATITPVRRRSRFKAAHDTAMEIRLTEKGEELDEIMKLHGIEQLWMGNQKLRMLEWFMRNRELDSRKPEAIASLPSKATAEKVIAGLLRERLLVRQDHLFSLSEVGSAVGRFFEKYP